MPDSSAPNTPAVILVEPQLGANIGMAARAMLNCGLSDLRIVAPRDGWPNTEARDAAVGASRDIVERAALHDTTAGAVADLTRVYATTGRGREMTHRVLTPRAAGPEMRREAAAGKKIGVLFGGERAGLSNEDVSLADTIVQAPLNPEFKSLNLGHAVLMIAYEWLAAEDATDGETLDLGTTHVATKAELENFMRHLVEGLDQGNYFRAIEMRPIVVRNLRNLFQRAQATEQELRTMHGVVEALKRAGRDTAKPPKEN